ncbi:MAG: EamA family transporter [Clostridium sp.]|nr:EamA family transporter [Clostridium sp.]
MAFLSRNLILDLLLTALAPAIWGTTYIVTSQFLPPDRPFIAALLRVLPAGIALLIWSRRFPQRGEWAKLIVTGILNIGAFQALLFIAAYRLPGGLAAVIGAIQPLLVMLLAWCVDRQRSPWLAVFSAIAGILGMAMLLLSPHTVLDPLGIGAAFLGAISMALGTWLSRRWALSLPIVALTGWQLTIGGVVLAPVALIVDPPLHQVTVLQAAGYLWLCLAGAMLAYGLWFRGIGRLSPVAVSAMSLLSPVTAGGSKNEKSPVTGLDIAACGVGGGSQTSHPQAACPAAPSATIRLFRQLGGHMDLVAGVRFGNVIGSALFFRNGCDFRFCAVQGVCCHAHRMSEASERDQGEHTGSGE